MSCEQRVHCLFHLPRSLHPRSFHVMDLRYGVEALRDTKRHRSIPSASQFTSCTAERFPLLSFERELQERQVIRVAVVVRGSCHLPIGAWLCRASGVEEVLTSENLN